MGSANKHNPSTSKLPKKDSLHPLQLETPRNPSTSSDTEDKNPNPRESAMAEKASVSTGGVEEDSVLTESKVLTRQELIRRRSRRVKQLEKCYRNHYWALMEDLKVQYREYYWKYGKSPFEKEEERENGVEGSGENNDSNNNNNCNRLGLGFGGNSNSMDGNSRCGFAGCKSKAMALTNYCHSHILSDTKQKLYTACTYLIKRAFRHVAFTLSPSLQAHVRHIFRPLGMRQMPLLQLSEHVANTLSPRSLWECCFCLISKSSSMRCSPYLQAFGHAVNAHLAKAIFWGVNKGLWFGGLRRNVSSNTEIASLRGVFL
ncbi:hypothetical protein HHK36_013218 [Tetracentron sinense]|uniref:KAT8 regulatory NSL complex subunit 2 n=1 Tax=Tetracentron sinense TaxID=13715 RepID=A0A834ZAC4_TETSI|nr:hypothetical protein HHK36_013218 [Tetracentron sinense]